MDLLHHLPNQPLHRIGPLLPDNPSTHLNPPRCSVHHISAPVITGILFPLVLAEFQKIQNPRESPLHLHLHLHPFHQVPTQRESSHFAIYAKSPTHHYNCHLHYSHGSRASGAATDRRHVANTLIHRRGVSLVSLSLHFCFQQLALFSSPLYFCPACLYFIPQNKTIGSLQKTPRHQAILNQNQGDVYFRMFEKSMTNNKWSWQENEWKLAWWLARLRFSSSSCTGPSHNNTSFHESDEGLGDM